MKTLFILCVFLCFLNVNAMPTDSINRNPIFHFVPSSFFGLQQYSGFEFSYESSRFKFLNDEGSIETSFRLISSGVLQEAMYEDFGWDIYGTAKGGSTHVNLRLYPRKRHDGRDEDFLAIGIGFRKVMLYPSEEYLMKNDIYIDLNRFPKNFFKQNQTSVIGQFKYGQRFCLGPKVKLDAWAGLQWTYTNTKGVDLNQFRQLSLGTYVGNIDFNPFVGISFGVDTKMGKYKWE